MVSLEPRLEGLRVHGERKDNVASPPFTADFTHWDGAHRL